MPPDAPIEADEVHVLDTATATSSRLGLLLILVSLLGVAAFGAWIVIADPFADADSSLAPAPADDNLLASAWSFETTEDSSPGVSWRTPDEAPAGFAFTEGAAVSGAFGAEALPSEAGWARIVSNDVWRIAGRNIQVELSATSSAPGVSLLARFEAAGRPAIETVVASGSGGLLGRATPPQGYDSVRVGIGCLGAGSVDDVSLRMLPAAEDDASSRIVREIGVFDIVVGDPQGVCLFRGQDLVARMQPLSLRAADGRALPATAAQLPGLRSGQAEVAFADGSSVPVRFSLADDANRLVFTDEVDGLPAGARLVRHAVVSGTLADAPVGVRSSRGYERFVDDFALKGVDALVLGRTQDRLVLTADEPFDLTATHRADGSVGLTIERAASGDVTQQITLQASFQEERVLAAGLADEARAAERSGALGDALARLEQIVTDYPYDEQVLAAAMADRARLKAAMQLRLDVLQADLEDALFLGSAQRCYEVRAEAEALARTYQGSTAEAEFLAKALSVDVEAKNLLAEFEGRHRERLEALLHSFEEHGGYPSVAAELREALVQSDDRFSAADIEASGVEEPPQ